MDPLTAAYSDPLDRRLGRLGGDPQIQHQQRGARWEARLRETLPYDAAIDDAKDSGLSRLHRTQLWIADSASITYYDPFRDTPQAYIDFTELGEKIWATGFRWDEGLVQATAVIHEEYGPLSPVGAYGGPAPVSVYQHWIEACRLSLAFVCYQSMRPEGTELRSTVAQRIIDLSSHELLGVPENFSFLRGFHQQCMEEWSQFLARHHPADRDVYNQRAGAWLNRTINSCLGLFSVQSQVRFSPPGAWFSSYVATTLGGALWGQLIGLMLEGSTVKRCKYERCRKRFETSNARREYCSDLCKGNRKKRDQRRRSQ